MDEIKRDLQNPSKATHEDLFGKGITYICIGFVSLLVISILYFITTRGLQPSRLTMSVSGNSYQGQLGTHHCWTNMVIRKLAHFR